MEPDAIHVADETVAQILKATAALRRVLPEQSTSHAELTREDRAINPAIHCSDLASAFEEIARTKNILTHAGDGSSPKIMPALAEYRRLLKEFRVILPRIQGWLLAERERLARKHSHSAAVENWLRANRQTRY